MGTPLMARRKAKYLTGVRLGWGNGCQVHIHQAVLRTCHQCMARNSRGKGGNHVTGRAAAQALTSSCHISDFTSSPARPQGLGVGWGPVHGCWVAGQAAAPACRLAALSSVPASAVSMPKGDGPVGPPVRATTTRPGALDICPRRWNRSPPSASSIAMYTSCFQAGAAGSTAGTAAFGANLGVEKGIYHGQTAARIWGGIG